MIFGGFMLSAIISKLVSIIDESNMEQKALRNKLLGVEQWVKDRGLPKPERIRILNFFRKQPTKPYDERALLMDIPFEMRARVLHVGPAPRPSHVPLAESVAPVPAGVQKPHPSCIFS